MAAALEVAMWRSKFMAAGRLPTWFHGCWDFMRPKMSWLTPGVMAAGYLYKKE